MSSDKYAIIALASKGVALGKKLLLLLEDSDLYIPEKFGDDNKGINLFEDMKEVVSTVFQKYKGLIFIMATGIVVRTIAPFIKDKTKDPGIVVLDEKGKNVISLLSGHMGGANDLANKVSELIGAKPVITTATDVNNLPCIEDLANKFNLVIEETKSIKRINSAILEKSNITVVDENIERLEAIKRYCNNQPNFIFSDSESGIMDGNVGVFITNRIKQFTVWGKPFIILRPQNIVVGVGCNKGACAEEFEETYLSTLKEEKLSPFSVRNLASIDLKKDEPGLLKFAERFNLNIAFYNKEELERLSLPSGRSKIALKHIGIGGVCEPAALLSSGAQTLLMKKKKAGNITMSLAEAPFISSPEETE